MEHMRRKFDLRALFIMLMDALCVAIAIGLALWARFDFSIDQVPKQYVQAWLPIVAAAQLIKGREEEKDLLMRWIDVVDYS